MARLAPSYANPVSSIGLIAEIDVPGVDVCDVAYVEKGDESSGGQRGVLGAV